MGNGTPRIGLSACFFHPDLERNIFKGKTLLYCEQSMAHYVMGAGIMPCLIPSAGGTLTLEDMVDQIDGLLLAGGDDVAPQCYGEEPLRPEWAGDYIRDRYEIALTRLCLERDKPILGICRGPQVMNVALGGTLYQDITTQCEGALVHRSHEIYDANMHEIEIAAGSGLARMYPGPTRVQVNSIHHQGIKDVADGLEVEARSTADGIIEALRYTAQPDTYMFGVQWHPEFIDDRFPQLLDPRPIMDEFLAEVRARTAASVARNP